jgi:hypothetical protein
MKNNYWIAASILALSIALAGFWIGNTLKIGKAYDRSVRVKGLSERTVNADLAVWPLTITITGNDLTNIKSTIEKQNQIVYEFFINQGFNEDELQKGSINIEDIKANVYGNNNYQDFRYIAKSDFTVRTKNIDLLQKALSSSLDLLSEGIIIGSKNTWRPIEYSFSSLNSLKPEMIEEATKNAREVAEKFAKDSNSKVGKIRNAQQGLFTINDLDSNTPHIKNVRVVSTIDYQLED